MLEQLDHEFGWSRGIGGLHLGGIIMQHDKLGKLGIVVNIGRFGGEILRGEDAFLPDLLDAFVQFALRLDLANQPHFVIDNLPKGCFGLEPVAQAVVVEKPAAVNEALNGLIDESGIVVRLKHCKSQVGRIDTALAGLDQAVQKGGRCHAMSVRRPTGFRKFQIDFLCVRKRALLWAGNIRFDHLFVLRAVKAAGQIVRNLFIAQIEMMRADEETVFRAWSAKAHGPSERGGGANHESSGS